MACGRRVRASRMALSWSCTGSLPWSPGLWLPSQESVHLGRRGHGVRAGQPRRHDGPGGVSEAHHALDVPPGQQPVAKRSAERVAGAEAVHDVDRYGRYCADPGGTIPPRPPLLLGGPIPPDPPWGGRGPPCVAGEDPPGALLAPPELAAA